MPRDPQNEIGWPSVDCRQKAASLSIKQRAYNGYVDQEIENQYPCDFQIPENTFELVKNKEGYVDVIRTIHPYYLSKMNKSTQKKEQRRAKALKNIKEIERSKVSAIYLTHGQKLQMAAIKKYEQDKQREEELIEEENKQREQLRLEQQKIHDVEYEEIERAQLAQARQKRDQLRIWIGQISIKK